VQPNRDTREAYERLLRTDAPSVLSPESLPGRPAVPPLIGRDRVWAQLQEACHTAVAGEPRFVLLAGEAGIGKTRLAEELLTWAGRQGVVTASARCYGAEGELPFAPVVTWLRALSLPDLDDVWLAEVARLLPEVRINRPDLPILGPLNEAWQRRNLFDAFSRAVIGSGQPTLLFVDDLQWCDHDTLEWLHYLLRYDPLARLLIVGTARSEEREENGSLTALVEALHRSEQLIEIELGALTEAETLSLAERLAGTELDSALAPPLYWASEGNPLFVVEMMRAGWPGGGSWGIEYGDEMAHIPLPPKVQLVIEARLAQLSPSARDLAGLAATIGREFTFDMLAQAGDGDEDALARDLDELWRRRIVREQGGEAYDFSHDTVREVAYAGLSATRRRFLHRRVAQAMEVVYADGLDAVYAQVATHYERADMREQAVSCYLRAAEVAKGLYANSEAVGCYRRALAMITVVSPGEAGKEKFRGLGIQLYEGLGDVLALTAQYSEALTAYDDALKWVSTGEPIVRARLQRKGGKVWETQRHYEEAGEAYNRAESVLDSGARDAGTAWWQEWTEIQVDRMWLQYWQGHLQTMIELMERVRPAVEQHGAPSQRFRFVHAVFLMALRRDRFLTSDETLGYARELVTASQELDDLGQITWAHFGLGFALLWRAEHEEGEKELQAALGLAERGGDVVLQSRCLAYLSVLYRRWGQVEQARHYNARSLEVATAVQMPEYVGIARANLAWMAWRAQDLPEVVDNGHAALSIWRPQPAAYAFYWTALCPLIGVALNLGQQAEAIDYARELLEPAQMRLPGPLAETLGQAIQAWEEKDAGAAQAHLDHALELAQEMGYL
jgi:tetratricopeptide (TPR) repeat protein